MSCCNESIHGHEVMHLLQDYGPISRANLESKVLERYGEFPSFHTCSASGMDLKELLRFLLERSKISEGPSGLFMGSQQHTCDQE